MTNQFGEKIRRIAEQQRAISEAAEAIRILPIVETQEETEFEGVEPKLGEVLTEQ